MKHWSEELDEDLDHARDAACCFMDNTVQLLFDAGRSGLAHRINDLAMKLEDAICDAQDAKIAKGYKSVLARLEEAYGQP